MEPRTSHVLGKYWPTELYPAPPPYSFRLLRSSLISCPNWPWTCCSPASASWIAGNIGLCHCWADVLFVSFSLPYSKITDRPPAVRCALPWGFTITALSNSSCSQSLGQPLVLHRDILVRKLLRHKCDSVWHTVRWLFHKLCAWDFILSAHINIILLLAWISGMSQRYAFYF